MNSLSIRVAVTLLAVTLLDVSGEDLVFSLADTYRVPDVQAVVVSDIDSDGNPDLLLPAGGHGAILRWLGNGDGTFTPMAPLEGVNGSAYLRSGDLNADGYQDLVLSDDDTLGFFTLLGRGDGTFGEPWFCAYGAVIAYTSLGDINGDRILDVAAGTATFFGVGDGTFEFAQDLTPFEYARRWTRPFLVDCAGDAALELILDELYPSFGVQLLRLGDGTAFEEFLTVPANDHIIDLADLDQDGNMDIVLYGGQILRGSGNGAFTEIDFPFYEYGPGVVHDLDRDGLPDLIIADVDEVHPSLAVFRNEGDCTFERTWYRETLYGCCPTTAAADLNRDGLSDIVLAYEGTVQIFLNGRREFRRGDSNANNAIDIADAVFVLSHLFAHGPAPSCKDAADANDDGNLDIADAIKILGHLFAQAGPLAPPFESCGSDSTPDDLGCGSFAPCEGP